MIFFKKLFLMNFLLFVFYPVAHGAQEGERIDYDLRLEPVKSHYFYLLKEKFKKKEKININNTEYSIAESLNELFIDDYYDTKLLTLVHKKSSLRHRKRFVDSVETKQLAQFKVKDKIGFKEYKINIEPDQKIYTYKDFTEFINSSKNLRRGFLKDLKKFIDSRDIRYILTATQYRDRFYAHDQYGETVFTISFDEVVFSKNLLSKPYLAIEFEVNEKIMQIADLDTKTYLISGLNQFVESLDNKNIYFKEVVRSKYMAGIDILEIKISPSNLLEVILIYLFLFVILLLFFKPVLSHISLKKKKIG